jgi:hypothetical protein
MAGATIFLFSVLAASPVRHEFWGISTGSADKELAPNQWVADNFVLAAGVGMQKQPSARIPHPVPKNLSKIMNKTVTILARAPQGKKTLTFNGGASCGNHHPQVSGLPSQCSTDLYLSLPGQYLCWQV